MRKTMRNAILCFAIVTVCACVWGVGFSHVHAHAQTAAYDFGMGLAPAVVAEVSDVQNYADTLQAERKPGSVLFGVDSELSATAADGSKLGGLTDVWNDLSQAGILAVIRLADMQTASVFADFASQNGLSDFCITGTDARILQAVKDKLPNARVCFDFRNGTKQENAYGYIRESRAVGAHIVLLNSEQADTDTVRYLQGMLTTVWAHVPAANELSVAAAVTRGAYGIVATQCAAVYDVFDKFPAGSITRGYYNIGHRGLPLTQPENSVEGCVAAVEAGATHVEVDIKVSADDKLVVMHDDTIDRTTNGTGAVSSMTLAELDKFRIVKTYKGTQTEPVKIPTLDQVFQALKETDVVFVVEIKTGNGKCCELLKACMEACDVTDRVAVISFNDSQLERLHALLPEVPCATLNDVDEYSAAAYFKTAAKNNFGFDLSFTKAKYDFMNGEMKNRGYAAWCWTYEGFVSVHAAAESGITGITNNSADAFSDNVKKWNLPSSFRIGANQDVAEREFSVAFLTFGGETVTDTAKVFLWEPAENGYRVILRYNDGGSWIYSDIVTVSVEPSPEKQGCGGGLQIGGSLFAGIMILASAVVSVLSKRSVKMRKK